MVYAKGCRVRMSSEIKGGRVSEREREREKFDGNFVHLSFC
jgi:hypothetical protein